MLRLYTIQVVLVPPNIDKEIVILSDYTITEITKRSMAIVTESVKLDNVNTISILNILEEILFSSIGYIVSLASTKAIKVIVPNAITVVSNSTVLIIPYQTDLEVGTIIKFNMIDGSICIQE